MKIQSIWLSGLLFMLLLTGCDSGQPSSFQGYVEGEFVEVATSEPGRLEQLSVAKGTEVEAGTPLFHLEVASEKVALRQAQSELAVAQANLRNSEIGKRPQELAVIQAQREQAQAELQRALAERARDVAQFAFGGIAQSQLERSQAAADVATARVLELERQEMVAALPARDDQIAALQAQVSAAQAAVEQVEWRLGQKRVAAPVAGLVFDTLYQTGEWVATGHPVVRLLPHKNIKLRFFVPTTVAGGLAVGQAVKIRCDGHAEGVAAEISFISTEAEFTPPVIYSNDTRSKLVFMVEARLLDHVTLHPGQPVECILD